MSPLPNVSVTLSNGNLGRVLAGQDGTAGLIVTGVAVAGQFALGDILGPYTAPSDAEANGINAAYDTTNSVMAYQHIVDFFNRVPKGTKLYVMVVATTVTMTQMCDPANSYAKKLLSQTNGEIKLLGITRIPDGAYTPTFSGQFEQDLHDAITKIKLLQAEEFGFKRPFRAIIEGRNFQGTVASAADLRNVSTGPNANQVMVMIGQDYDVAQSAVYKNKYAAVGIALGRAAAIPVHRNIGRVKDGDLGITRAGLSNGALMATFTDANLITLNDRGFVFFHQHPQKAGYFFNDDHMAAPITDDYSQLAYARVVDKAARIAVATYTDEILDTVQVDSTTGKLSLPTVKHYQGLIESAIADQMTGEISGVICTIDPDQNVLSTSNIAVQLDVTPVGTTRTISVTIALTNPAA